MDALSACPGCGAGVERGQEYCLECGARVVVPRRPLHWLWPSLAALAVAAGGAAAAIAGSDGGPGGGATIVALTPLRPVQARPAERTAKAQPAGRPSPDRLLPWPAGSGYTIVLSAVPTRGGIEAAKAKARGALRAGLRDVGVLVSSSFASLHPGYYIVFSGVYESAEEAQADLPRAVARFPSAHVRPIAR